MEDQNEETTDGSSIKPVSSLRSHFEQMNNKSTSVATPAPRPLSPKPKIHANHTGGQNMNMVNAAHFKQQMPHSTGATALAPPASGMRPRPLSMAPTSTQQYSPIVTIEPPSSPPKPGNLNLPLSSPSSFLSAEASWGSFTPPASTPGTSPRHFRIPSRPPTPLVEPRRSPMVSPSQPPEPPPPRRSAELRREPVSKSAIGPPPPINRSEKPKIPAKTTPGQPNEKKELAFSAAPRIRDSKPPPFLGPGSRSTSPARDLMLSTGVPYRPFSIENQSKLYSSPGYFDPPPLNRYDPVARRNDLETNGQSRNLILIQDAGHLDGQKPALPTRPNVAFSAKQSMDPSKSSNNMALAQDGQKRLRNGISPSRVPASESPTITTPKRILSNPVSQSQTPTRAHGRSMTVDQITDRAPSDYKFAATANDQDQDNVITRGPSAEGMAANENLGLISTEYPDSSHSNRRPPFLTANHREISTKYDTRLFDICGQYVCTSGVYTRAWDLENGDQIMGLAHGDTIKILAVSFRCALGPGDEGQKLWLGNNVGDLMEVDIPSQIITATRTGAHNRHEIIKIYRRLNEMWTLDNFGTLHIWGLVDMHSPLKGNPAQTFRLPKGHTFSILVGDELWYASGKDLRVFAPTIDGRRQFQILQRPLCQVGAGEIVSGTAISTQRDRIYFGHTDGKVTIYSRTDYSWLGTVNVSMYKINSMSGVGQYLWAGYNTGMIYVYDTTQNPWVVKKDWRAHDNPVISVMVDRFSFYKTDYLQVISLGADNVLRSWDGLLEEDWLENRMQERDNTFCKFEDIKALVMTWNAGASTPHSLRYAEKDASFLRELLQSSNSPDILVFGFQELVDLEDKKATAMSFFKSKKKDASEQEHMSHQYRDWRDYLIRCLDDYMPKEELYHLLQSSTLVGLYTCVFVRSHLRERIKNLSATEVKRGMGGLHGNKGALILRFILDDTSMCFINCHLAAGQSQTKVRNHDVSAILESTLLPAERDLTVRRDSFIGGGDGSMILDHEICILNGDLNYRIDTMGRDAVVGAIKAGNLSKLLERDQLLVSRRRNPGFRLRSFHEMPINFDPTYKYDVGTDTYDTSEKKRAPAWCDRILYRSGYHQDRIQQFDYRRHEVRVSDHRPVTALFNIKVKKISSKARAKTWEQSLSKFEEVKQQAAAVARRDFLANTCGLDSNAAARIVAAPNQRDI